METFESDDDPRGWSIDRVVYELCHNPNPQWSLIPDRHLIEDTLRQNYVDGDNLLALDMVTLKEDLGITPFGQRRAIIKAIEYFRAHSTSWQQSARLQAQPSPAPYTGFGFLSSTESRSDTYSPLPQNAGQPRLATLSSQKDGLVQTNYTVTASASTTSGLPFRSTAELSSHLPVVPNDPKPPPKVSTLTKKKVIPTIVPQIDRVTAVSAANDTAYLSPSSVPVQDIFYHKISSDFGDNFYRVPMDSATDFFVSKRYPNGQRQEVARRIKHYLRQDVIALPATNALIKLPYSQGRLQVSVSESYFTMFAKGNAQTRVFRLDDFPEVKAVTSSTANLPAPTASLNQASETDWHDLDYLLDKYPVESSDHALPVYGDSGDEGNFDEDTWREIQEERNEKHTSIGRTMGRAEVEATIDETINEMKKEWHDIKLAKIQLKAYRLWIQVAKKKKNRQEELRYVEYQKGRFARMKTNIKRALADEVWRTRAELKKQCQNIELAVWQYEEFKYYDEVLHQDTPPIRPSPTAVKKARVQKQQVVEDEDEEVLDSESDITAEDDDDFIVEESSQTGSIHHVPDEPDPDWNPVLPETKTSPRSSTKDSSAVPLDVGSPMEVDGQANDADIDSESDEEIVTPMRRRKRPGQTIVRRSRSDSSDLDRPPRLPKTKYVAHGRTEEEPVDLTFSSPAAEPAVAQETGTDFEVHTPELNPSPGETPPTDKPRKLSVVSLSSSGSSTRASFQGDSGLPGIQDNGVATETDDISSDHPIQSDIPLTGSSHKKRKRKVEDSQQARDMQQSDQVRIQELEQRRKQMATKLAQMQTGGNGLHDVINSTEPPVYLHPFIRKRAMPHQVRGIQFMWREIIEDPKHQGCILAHTMGLGKTMQVISLMVTIALCSQSSDPNVRKLIPARLRKSKSLVLCPASLVENWFDELVMWTPSNDVLGTIYKLDSPRLETVEEWSRHGGVLLMSYERFRGMISKSIKEKANYNIDVEKILLEAPTLVVADEAHKLKNPASIIHKYAKRFKTTSRIAMTGSPLNNHLEEYYAMVDWIAPGYLGTLVQFKSKYSEPIIDGLWSDSKPYEKRLSLRKLHVLKRDLDPKINRADISVVAKDMPAKTEFYITVPLTDLQKQAYDIYIKYMLPNYGAKRAKTSHVLIMDWLAMLSWLCHHPYCFYQKIQQRIRDLEGKGRKDGDEEVQEAEADAAIDVDEATSLDVATPDQLSVIPIREDGPIDTDGTLLNGMYEARELFQQVDNPAGVLEHPMFSYRTMVTRELIIQAKAKGDKMLVFSHSIPTLNYLEKMVREMGYPYFRLDGGTKVDQRQAYTKTFNQSKGFQLFLISMRAGGLGLNLQGANRVIIFDFSFNPAWEEQAIGRAYRLNQKLPVFVYRFQAGGTFEDVLFNKAVFKTQLFGRVVDKKNPKRQATRAQPDYLFPVRDIPQQDLSEALSKDPGVLDIVASRLNCIRSIVLTETFQKEEDEPLNAEEEKAAEEEYLHQRLQRDNPAAYQAMVDARNEAQMYANWLADQEWLWLQNRPSYPPYPYKFPADPTLAYPSPAHYAAAKAKMDAARAGALPPTPFTRADLDMPLKRGQTQAAAASAGQPARLPNGIPQAVQQQPTANPQPRPRPQATTPVDPDHPMS